MVWSEPFDLGELWLAGTTFYFGEFANGVDALRHFGVLLVFACVGEYLGTFRSKSS